MSGREVGSPVAQDLVGRGVRAERPAYRDDRCCSHPNTRIGIFSVVWFQIETKFYFDIPLSASKFASDFGNFSSKF